MGINPPFVIKPDTAYMEVPRCDTCRHWAEGYCMKVDGSIDGPVAYGKARACSATNVFESGRLETQPDFGCVQWESSRDG